MTLRKGTGLAELLLGSILFASGLGSGVSDAAPAPTPTTVCPDAPIFPETLPSPRSTVARSQGPERGSLLIIGGGTNPPEIRETAIRLAGGKSAKWVNIPTAGTDQEITDAKYCMVIGAGTIGLLIVALLKIRGARNIIISDATDFRLQTARKMQADHTINSREVDFLDAVKKITAGKLCDFALEAVGIVPTATNLFDCLRIGGTAVWVGLAHKMVEVNMQKIVTKEDLFTAITSQSERACVPSYARYPSRRSHSWSSPGEGYRQFPWEMLFALAGKRGVVRHGNLLWSL